MAYTMEPDLQPRRDTYGRRSSSAGLRVSVGEVLHANPERGPEQDVEGGGIDGER